MTHSGVVARRGGPGAGRERVGLAGGSEPGLGGFFGGCGGPRRHRRFFVVRRERVTRGGNALRLRQRRKRASVGRVGPTDLPACAEDSWQATETRDGLCSSHASSPMDWPERDPSPGSHDLGGGVRRQTKLGRVRRWLQRERGQRRELGNRWERRNGQRGGCRGNRRMRSGWSLHQSG